LRLIGDSEVSAVEGGPTTFSPSQRSLGRTYECVPASLSNSYALAVTLRAVRMMHAADVDETAYCNMAKGTVRGTQMVPIIPIFHQVIVRASDLFSLLHETITEVRENRRKLEAELFHNRYRISSKNDDDLPIVR
jgi:hypothetical protein